MTCSGPNASWQALVDASMLCDKAIDRLLQRYGIRARWVLEGSTLQSFGRHGPVLLSVPPGDTRLLRDLVSLCQAKPALSFLSLRCDVDSLVAVLQWLAWVETDDGDAPLYCRFADTRVTSSLLAVLQTHQRETLAAVLNCWCWPDRLGHGLSCCKFDPGVAKVSAVDHPLRFDAQQFAQMLTMAEPDMVYQMLVEKMPDILPLDDHGATHLRLDRMIAAARSHGLEDLPDLFQFVVLGLSTFDEFHSSPILSARWGERVKQRLRFTDWVNDWPDEVWTAIDARQQTSARAESNS